MNPHIEKAARAIPKLSVEYDWKGYRVFDAEADEWVSPPYRDEAQAILDMRCRIALAVLQSIAEPTEEMVRAPLEQDITKHGDYVWRAMHAVLVKTEGE